MSTFDTDTVFDAIEKGDVAEFRTLFADGATLRRNTADVDVPVEIVAEQLGMLYTVAQKLTYSARELFAIADGFMSQQVLELAFPSGTVVRMPTIVRFYVDDAGRVRRMEEWCDSAQERAIEHEMVAFASEKG